MAGYSYGIKNAYRPTGLISKAYGWSSRPQYQRADVPTGLVGQTNITDPEVLLQQFAYEWFMSGELNNDSNLSNPPFISGAAGRLHPALRDADTGQPARILRGFIRRADYEAGKPLSKARLYFMYNPESIQRDYVSYLNSTALDPFNTVFESGNLVAPPSFMDFSFSLFFDRQEEATQKDHPGVFVDYQFFDLVVRNVVPSDASQSSNTLPDNGVMMIAPRDITVVFSPQLTVQGRPLNAKVNFERFTHRMTPTRMTIDLTMRVIYMGPMRDQVEYKAEQLANEVRIPIDEVKTDILPWSWIDHEEDTKSWWKKLESWDLGENLEGIAGGISAGLSAGESLVNSIIGSSGDANNDVRRRALAWAELTVVPGGTGQVRDDPGWTNYFGADSGTGRYNLPHSADCSGLVTQAYIATGRANAQIMGWIDHPGTATIIALAKANKATCLFKELDSIPWQYRQDVSMLGQTLQYGDILIRDGHVVFFKQYEPTGALTIFAAQSAKSIPEVGKHTFTKGSYKWYLLRPTPVGSTSVASLTSTWNGPR